MRSAIESMKIGSGTVAPVAASNSGRCPTVDTAESMCPLLDNLEERTTILLSEMGEAAEVEESDLVTKVASVEAENFSYELTTDAGPTCSPGSSRWEEFLSESASRWMAQDSPANCAASQADAADPTPEQLAVLMAPTRSEPSRVQWDGGDGDDGDDGDDFPGEVELDVEPPGDSSFTGGSGSVFHAHSDGHVMSSQSDLLSEDGVGYHSKPWRQRFHSRLNAAKLMRLRLFGRRLVEGDTESGDSGMTQHQNVDCDDHEALDRGVAVLPSYFQADANSRLPRLLHGTGPEKTSLKTAAGSEDPALQSPFFPKETGEGPVHRDDVSEDPSVSESSGRTSEGEFTFRSLDLPLFLGDLQRDGNGNGVEGGYGQDAPAADMEWNLKSLGPEEWEVMAMCLHCPGQGAELRRRLLEPVGFWPRIEESATPMGPVGPILLLRPDRDDAQRRASHASLASVATAKLGMDSYLRQKRRSTLPQILGLPPQAVKAS